MRRDKIIKFFKLALYQAELFSKDPSTKVCCLFIAPESLQILSCGYNGMPRGINESIMDRWTKPEKYKYIVHSETNAIYNACRNGTLLKDSICLVTFFPCTSCAKGIIQVGASKLITVEPDFTHKTYGDDFKFSLEMLCEAGVEIIYVSNTEVSM